MKKLITDELIENKMEKLGLLHAGKMDSDDMLKCLKDEYYFEITHNLTDYDNAQIHFYSETTADDYEIYVATENNTFPSITEDVYYYESDWFTKLGDYMKDGCTIYMDEYAMDEGPFIYAVEEVYEELYDMKQTEIINELKDEGYEQQ